MKHKTITWSTGIVNMSEQDMFNKADTLVKTKILPFLTSFSNITLLEQVDTDGISYKVYHLGVSGFENIDFCVSFKRFTTSNSLSGANDNFINMGIAPKGAVFTNQDGKYQYYINYWVFEICNSDKTIKTFNFTFDYIETDNVLYVIYNVQYDGNYYLDYNIAFLKDNKGEYIAICDYYYPDNNFPTKATLYVKNFDYSESDTVLISEDAIYSRGNSYAGVLQKCKLMYHSSLPKNTLIEVSDGNKYRNIGNRLFILDNDGGKQ